MTVLEVRGFNCTLWKEFEDELSRNTPQACEACCQAPMVPTQYQIAVNDLLKSYFPSLMPFCSLFSKKKTKTTNAFLESHGLALWHVGAAVAIIVVVVLIYKFVQGRSNRESIFGLGSGTKDFEKHTLEANKYVGLFSKKGTDAERLQNYEEVVNSYYDLATDFYEYGWGSSFHFAQRSETETLAASISRHEHFLAHKLKLDESTTVVDVGCGIGGPAREISRFSGAHVTGLNNNAYQVSRANLLTQRQHIAPEKCNFVKGDFMDQPFRDNSFDSAYAIEATCHAPDRTGCYAEILRVVKPGGHFACYEWATTGIENRF